MTKDNNTNSKFTLFGKGYWSEKLQKYVPSTRPVQSVDITWAGEYIISERARYHTEQLRSMIATASDQELRDYKLLNFDAVAGAGTFSRGSAAGLIERSPYVVVDVDDLSSTEEAEGIRDTLISDPYVETALCFISPKGRGVKWWAVLPEEWRKLPFNEQYATLSRHIGFHYGIEADPTGSNVNRLCFLPYDPKCYINPKYSQQL